MSKKRDSTDSNYDEKAIEDKESFSQRDDNIKRARLASSSNTTLQDLPREMLEYVLVGAVVMEVMGMKLAKCVWKEKAGLVMNRLQAVCTQWKAILTTKVFRNEVHRVLDGTAQKTKQLEVLYQCPLEASVYAVTAMKDEIFLLSQPRGQNPVINVCDRNNNFMSLGVKDVIQLPGIIDPCCITACSALDCLFLIYGEPHNSSVLRIKKEQEHLFNLSTLITDLQLEIPSLTVSTNGSLAILSRPDTPLESPDPPFVSIYNHNGLLQHKITLFDDIFGLSFLSDVMYLPNGNLVLSGQIEAPLGLTQLMEVDARGNILRKCQSILDYGIEANLADIYGRIWLIDLENVITVLDSELNPLDFIGPEPRDLEDDCPLMSCFNVDRNECVRMNYSSVGKVTTLTIFRFTEK